MFIAEFERKDLYSYYGVNEDNIKNKTERYSALIKGIVFLTNKGGVLSVSYTHLTLPTKLEV